MRKMILPLAALWALSLSGCVGLDFSPDGKSVAVSTSRGIAILPVDGGQSILIPNSKGGWLPIWSPDSSRILFTRKVEEKEELFLYEVSTKRSRRIESGLGWPYAWREDGKRFAALQKLEGGSSEMVWYDLAEGGVAQSVPVPDANWMVWLPDTDSIAFLASSNPNLFLVENGEVKQITKTDDIAGFSLSGDKKALLWVRKGANLKYQLLSLYRYDLKSRSVKRIEFPMRIPLINPDSARAPASFNYAAISPDGRRIAITVVRPVKRGAATYSRSICYVMGMDGSATRMVRQTEGRSDGEFLFPVWSRDSSRLGVYDLQDKKLVVAVFDSSGRNGKRILTETSN